MLVLHIASGEDSYFVYHIWTNHLFYYTKWLVNVDIATLNCWTVSNHRESQLNWQTGAAVSTHKESWAASDEAEGRGGRQPETLVGWCAESWGKETFQCQYRARLLTALGLRSQISLGAQTREKWLELVAWSVQCMPIHIYQEIEFELTHFRASKPNSHTYHQYLKANEM